MGLTIPCFGVFGLLCRRREPLSVSFLLDRTEDRLWKYPQCSDADQQGKADRDDRPRHIRPIGRNAANERPSDHADGLQNIK